MDPDNKVDYKETLFLPKTDFPMRAGLPAREPQWLDRWEKLKIYSKLETKGSWLSNKSRISVTC